MSRFSESQHTGQAFEAELERSFAWHYEVRCAHIEKNETPMRIVGRTRAGMVCVHTTVAQADYSGVMRGGQAVRIEAKWSAVAPMPRSRVKPHQLESLLRCSELGGIGLVVVGLGSDVYAVPAASWRDMREVFGRCSLREEDLAGYVVTREAGMLRIGEAIDKCAGWDR